jgi:type II secretory pathway pseudopilin PulG
MATLLSIVVFLLTWVRLTTGQEACGGNQGWYIADQYLYKPYDPAGGVNFAAAQAYCQGLISGSTDLAVVDSNNIKYVASMMSTWFPTNGQAWLNLTRSASGNAPDQGWVWTWSGTSSALNSSLWASGQPDGSGDYGAIGTAGSGVNYLVSLASTSTIGALCAIGSKFWVV